jgi:hypothetical protein
MGRAEHPLYERRQPSCNNVMRPRLHFPAVCRWKLDQTHTMMLVGIVLVTLLVYVRCLENGFVNDQR